MHGAATKLAETIQSTLEYQDPQLFAAREKAYPEQMRDASVDTGGSPVGPAPEVELPRTEDPAIKSKVLSFLSNPENNVGPARTEMLVDKMKQTAPAISQQDYQKQQASMYPPQQQAPQQPQQQPSLPPPPSNISTAPAGPINPQSISAAATPPQQVPQQAPQPPTQPPQPLRQVPQA